MIQVAHRSVSSLLRTLKFMLWEVESSSLAPSTELVVKETERDSDMFATTVHSPGPLELYDFHKAFLFCPVFQAELTLLRWCGVVSPESVSHERLKQAAAGRQVRSFALWSLLHRETIYYDKQPSALILPPSTSNSSKRQGLKKDSIVMRCSVPAPFCDTWWSIECLKESAEENQYKLLFGTSMIQSSLAAKVLDPIHRIYSRLLLASTKDYLLRQLEQEECKKKI